MSEYLTQTYTIKCAGEVETIEGTHLPMHEAQERANKTGQVCVIFYHAGRQYVYPY